MGPIELGGLQQRRLLARLALHDVATLQRLAPKIVGPPIADAPPQLPPRAGFSPGRPDSPGGVSRYLPRAVRREHRASLSPPRLEDPVIAGTAVTDLSSSADGRNLSEDEWARYLPNGGAHRPTCDQWRSPT